MNDNQINLPNESVTHRTKNADRNISSRESVTIIIASLAMAVLYSLCFTGREVYPKLSFFIFCCVAIVVMYATLNKINYMKNKKAFLWAIPIFIIATFNAVFQLDIFSYTNVVMIHILFAVMGYTAVKGKTMLISEISGWVDILRTCCGNILASFYIYKPLFKGRRHNTALIAVKIMIGILITLPVAGLIMISLIGADAVFRSIITNLLYSIESKNMNLIGHLICVFIVAIYLPGYVYNLKHMEGENLKLPECKLDVIIGVTFLSLINMIFLFFCVIQMAFLFTGGYMSLPEGIVYATYAREGFFQLLFVTILNFGVIIVFLKIFPTCINTRLVKIMLTMLCTFTGILICSSFYRMSLYISAYGYTDIRMMVITFLVMEMVCVFTTIAYLYSLPKTSSENNSEFSIASSRQVERKVNFPSLSGILKTRRDFLKQYLYIGLVFYIIVNITASKYTLTKLNIDRFYNGNSLDITQFHNNYDSVSLIANLVESEDFERRMDEHDKKLANSILANLKSNKIDRWQNWSFLQN